VEFRILGPLEIWHQSQPLALGGAKQRAVLAVLLLQANQVVSTDRLIDAVWGDEPPDTALASLQVHVSSLRKLLEGDRPRRGQGQFRLTRKPGYVLNVGPEELDLYTFESLVGEGKDALRAADPHRAATKLREALSLWRGQPLADFAYEPFARVEIERLEEARLAAMEERIEADLALGRHADLVGELDTLIAPTPCASVSAPNSCSLCTVRAGRPKPYRPISERGTF